MDNYFADVPDLQYKTPEPGFVVSVETFVGVTYGVVTENDNYYFDLKTGEQVYLRDKNYRVLGPFAEVMDYVISKNKAPRKGGTLSPYADHSRDSTLQTRIVRCVLQPSGDYAHLPSSKEAEVYPRIRRCN